MFSRSSTRDSTVIAVSLDTDKVGRKRRRPGSGARRCLRRRKVGREYRTVYETIDQIET